MIFVNPPFSKNGDSEWERIRQNTADSSASGIFTMWLEINQFFLEYDEKR